MTGPAPDPLRHEQRRARRPSGAVAPLRRSVRDRRIAGIAGGVARFTGAGPRVVRTIFALSVPLSWGVTLGGYLLLWMLLPLDGSEDRGGPGT